VYRTILSLLLFWPLLVFGQRVEIPKWHSVQETYWQISVDYLAIDDSGRFISDPVNVEDHWQILPYPSRIALSRRTGKNLSFQVQGAYSVYSEGKIVDGSVLDNNRNYWSMDVNAVFHLNNFLGWGRFFDPYLGIGTGFTRANKKSQGTLNTVAGAHFWISDRCAILLNSTGKFSMAIQGNNHLVHSAGLVYRFAIE
jgi:hypothetical protein